MESGGSLSSHRKFPCAELLQIDCANDAGHGRAALRSMRAHRAIGEVRAAHSVETQPAPTASCTLLSAEKLAGRPLSVLPEHAPPREAMTFFFGLCFYTVFFYKTCAWEK